MNRRNTSSSNSSDEIEMSAKNDIKELLDEFVVSPIISKIPDALRKTETAIKEIEIKTDRLVSQVPDSLSIASYVKTLLSSDFFVHISEDDGIEDIQSTVEEIKDKTDEIYTKADEVSASVSSAARRQEDINSVVGGLEKNLNAVVTKADKISETVTSVAKSQENISKLIEALIEEIEAQREMIEQQRFIIEQLSNVITLDQKKIQGMNKLIWKKR